MYIYIYIRRKYINVIIVLIDIIIHQQIYCSIELKKMERSYGLHLVFDQMTKLKHSSDGVIWTPVKHPYIPGTCDKL